MNIISILLCIFLNICEETPLPSGPTYSFITAQKNSTVSLIANFSQKKDVATLLRENNCASATSGGFYDTENKPLGLFQTGGATYGTPLQSALFNGFISPDGIFQKAPTGKFVLQTGPLLLLDSQILPLKIRNDEPARRIVVASTKENTLIFIAFYQADSVFQGPLLSELPQKVFELSQKENLGIMSAINLDGGSASAFIMGTLDSQSSHPSGACCV